MSYIVYNFIENLSLLDLTKSLEINYLHSELRILRYILLLEHFTIS